MSQVAYAVRAAQAYRQCEVESRLCTPSSNPATQAVVQDVQPAGSTPHRRPASRAVARGG
ncbi:hypothetical protein [Kribbella sancticallisti]|uniref:hypothetical protein n=1 Tax=Kribbella sancticallisti TaxID=460087 RepID=UPI0031D9881A